MKAVVVVEKGRAEVLDKPEPKLPLNYVKVKVRAVALNPTDWKHVASIATGGETVGCDFAGVMTEIGSAVTSNVKVGDNVFGAVHGSKKAHKDTGAFAEYIIAKDGLFAKIPQDMSFESAATLGVAVVTNTLALWQKLKLPRPEHPAESPYPILIYGGSTAMGMIAKLAGLYVLTTASKRNFELLTKEYGADEVFDYNEQDCSQQIRNATKNELRYVMDCIGEKSSTTVCAESLAERDTTGEGLHYTTLLSSKDFPRTDVDIQNVIGYAAFGEAYERGGKVQEASPVDYQFCRDSWPEWTKLMAETKLKPPRFEVKEGGLDGILDGLQILREGKNSAMKLVYRVAE